MALKPNAQAIKQGYVDACNAVLTRGGSVTSGAPIGDLSKSILAIPHDQTLTYHTGVGTKMQVTVPQSVEKYALVDKVGGMTYKIRNPDNLFPAYIDDKIPKNAGETLTTDNVSVTLNADGSITLNGKVNGFFLQFSEGYFYSQDGYHTFSFGTKLPEGTVLAYDILNFTDEETGEEWWDTQRNDISSGETTIYDSEFLFLSIEFPYAAEFNNITLYPTYSQSQEAIPYFKIQDAKVTEFVSEGANYFDDTTFISIENNNVNVSHENGALIVNGSASANLVKAYVATKLTAGIYTISTKDALPQLILMGIGKATKNASGGISWKSSLGDIRPTKRSFTFEWSKADAEQYYLAVTIDVRTGYTHNDVYIYPMLNYGTVAQPYKPYVGKLDTLTMPEYVRNIDGYGDGVNTDYYNYVDFKRKKIVVRSYRKVCDGTENWGAFSTNTEGYYRVLLPTPNIPSPVSTPSDKLSPIICNHYETLTGNKVFTRNRGCLSSLTYIGFYDPNYNTSDISLWKAHLADLYAQGNPLMVVYALAEPIEVDISAYLTDEGIIVEGGGTITAVNEYSQDLPTEITYLINTTGGG